MKPRTDPPLRFNLEEFSGAVGDYVTFLPIALAVSYSSTVSGQ
ncbi:hypothetical protein [Methanobacterium sp. CWC-01]|nr:hypothetical protein [Methanobacterium sp. CWC-01]